MKKRTFFLGVNPLTPLPFSLFTIYHHPDIAININQLISQQNCLGCLVRKIDYQSSKKEEDLTNYDGKCEEKKKFGTKYTIKTGQCFQQSTNHHLKNWSTTNCINLKTI